ncbi:MAG: hypothetical protein EXS31_02420 [Pedosphaera sp.]|nr:hypothetical protein [Pedosphaera sp.]
MPLGDFEREVLRVLAANRNPDSFIAGGTVLHQRDDTPRRSEDVDVFHDLPEALLNACEADSATLIAAGFAVEPVGRVQPEFRRAIIRRLDLQTKIEWVQDAAFRFFPVEPDLELGWRLNFWDAATNKVLAMTGRQKIRDFLDCLHLHERHLHLGALVWAAGGKDPGLTPEFILDWALRGNRFFPEDLADVRLGKPIDLVATKQAWFAAVQEARELVALLPVAEMGCLYLDATGKPVCPDPALPEFAKLTRHYGSVKGAWPCIVEN